jgi:hypothetical protein
VIGQIRLSDNPHFQGSHCYQQEEVLSSPLSALLSNKVIAMYLTTGEFSSHSSTACSTSSFWQMSQLSLTYRRRRALVSDSYRPLLRGGGGGGSEVLSDPEVGKLSLQGGFISSLVSVQSI